MLFRALTLLLILKICNCLTPKDYFDEELLIKPLPSGHIYSYFQFTTRWDQDGDSYDHCHLFPRALSEIVNRYNVQELHISLTEGLWRYENWGYPVVDAAPGAEVWAWFKDTTLDVSQQWVELSSALSGLLCASLNFIDASKSLMPSYTFRPSGVSSQEMNSTYLRYSSLPREIVCTENLTPWKKLLPCDSKRGLAALLNSAHIYNTNYHSLGIHLRPICRNTACTRTSIELRQTVSLIYDQTILGSRDWSIRKLFGLGLGGSCPLATTSKVYVDLTSNYTNTFLLNPPPSERILSRRGGHDTVLAVYDIKSLPINSLINIAGIYSKPHIFLKHSPPPIHTNRFIVGYGQERGGIVTKIYNNHYADLDIVILENIPWFMPIYLHTLKITNGGKELKPVLIKYTPGKERTRPYYLEILLRLPARSVTKLIIDFDYMFLKWQEYPPDANHGFYVGSAVITAMLPTARNYTGLPQDGSTISSCFNASRSSYMIQIRTESLIISLPTPDFSMPYNVICLSCTVVALAFGPLHNITTKTLRLKEIKKTGGFLTKLKKRLLCYKKEQSVDVSEKELDDSEVKEKVD